MKVNKIIKSTVKEELEIVGATLLSIEEAEEYLTRVERAYDCWWWLCSPSRFSYCATLVYCDGDIIGYGDSVHDGGICVRPALQIKNLESSNFEIGNTFQIDDYEFKIISDNLAWMYKQDIGHYAFNEDYEKGNDYETSDVKKVVDKWFKDLLIFNESK